MWKGKKVSVIIPAYNEEETIQSVIEEVYRDAPVDEVVVVDNNSKDGTAKAVRKTKAKLVPEPRQGYGFALQRGLKESSGDLVVLFEADGNFPAKDIVKLLIYSDDFDFVKGTRSRPELVEKGIFPPVLSWMVIIANIGVSKLQQFLFRGPVVTDAGCTLRLISRPALRKIMPYLQVGAGHFQIELTNLTMIAKIKGIEVPVHFTKRRGGVSKHGSFVSLVKIALAMIFHTLKQRVLSWFGYYKFG